MDGYPPNTPHLQTLGKSVKLGTPYEKTMAATAADTPTALGPHHQGQRHTSSQPLPDMEDIPVFPIQHARRTSPFNGVAPASYPWAPKFLPEQEVYTDGSDIIGHPRLEAAVVHIPPTLPSTQMMWKQKRPALSRGRN